MDNQTHDNLVCDICGDDVITTSRIKKGIPYLKCQNGHEWRRWTSHKESVCPNCGNYQKQVSAIAFVSGRQGCWYCGRRYNETNEQYLVRKRKAKYEATNW